MKRKVVLLASVAVILAGCGGLRDHSTASSATPGQVMKSTESHVMTVSVMGLNEGPLVEAIKIILQLPDGMTTETSSDGEVKLSGEGTLIAGSLHGQELCLVSLSPGGFKGGPEMFKIKVFGDAALADRIRVTYVHACGESGGQTYESSACSLASVKFRVE